MAQADALRTKPQRAARSRRQVHRSDRHLRGEAKDVCRRRTAGNNSLTPQRSKRCNDLFDGGCTKTKAGLDGSHIDPLADPQEFPPAGQAGQRLVDRRAVAQMKQSARAERRSLGQRRRGLHDAVRQTGHNHLLLIQVLYVRNII